MSDPHVRPRLEELTRVRVPLDDDLKRAIHDAFDVALDHDPVHLDGGEECAIWRVGDHVVRVSPIWRTDAELRWTRQLALDVRASVPEAMAPICSREGATYIRHAGYPVSLFPFVDGDRPGERTTWLAHAAGGLLARVHDAIAERTDRPASPVTFGAHAREPLPPELDDAELDAWHTSLTHRGSPRAAIHGDVYRGNILLRDSRIVALLDWDEAHDDFIAQEVAWTMWEFANVGGVELDEPMSSAFLDGYVTAGRRLPADFASDAIGFIRWRLRDEIRHQLTARAHGEAVDDEYLQHELTAFANLRDVERLA